MTAWLRSPPGFTTSIGQDETDSLDNLLTAGGTVDTKGSYTELVASSKFDATAITLYVGQRFTDSAMVDFLIDVAVGAAASEQVILSNLLFTQSNVTDNYMLTAYVPISIPAGSRISARVQTSIASGQVRVSAALHHGGCFADDTFNLCHSMGPNTSDSGGTEIDPGGTANTKGSWTEIVASSEFDCEALMVALGQRTNTSLADMEGLLDVGVGAASSEVVILSNLSYATHSTTDTIAPKITTPLPFHVPAGSRIAVRSQCNVTDANDRLIDVALYGFC